MSVNINPLTKIKLFVALPFLIICGYTALLFYGIPLAEHNKAVCAYPQLNKLLPWNAGCFYSAYFSKSVDSRQLKFEHRKLTQFHRKGGAAKHIRWYRSVFYRVYNSHFNFSATELLEMHKDFIEVSPNSISEVVSFLGYLNSNQDTEIAQQWLNDYCTTYVSTNSDYVLASLKAIMDKMDLQLSFQECNSRNSA